MIELTTKLIGVSIDSSFVQPRPFSKERLDHIGLRALDSFKANGLQPEHIGLRTVDVLFGYELNFTLFGGSTTFRLTGAHLILNFQNILNRDALRIVAETASRSHSLFEETEFLEHAIGVAAHLLFRDEQEEKAAAAELGGDLIRVRLEPAPLSAMRHTTSSVAGCAGRNAPPLGAVTIRRRRAGTRKTAEDEGRRRGR